MTWIWIGYILGQSIQINYQTFIMRFLGTRGTTYFLFIFFIFFDLTHIESRISPNIKILFCWTQILSCCPVTSIPCIFLAFEIYQWPRTLPPQYKKWMKNGNMESIKFPHTKYGNWFAGNTGFWASPASVLHCRIVCITR